LYAGQRGYPLPQVLKELETLLGRFVVQLRQVDVHRQNILGSEAEIHPHDQHKAFQKESGAHQQHQGQGNLGHCQYAPPPRMRPRAAFTLRGLQALSG
jgi:hypothetical protein